MPRHLIVGNVHASTTLLRRVRLPLLAAVDALAALRIAIQFAADRRKGVVVTGDKGAGKTVALARAVRSFRRDEALVNGNDASTAARDVALLPVCRPASRSEYIRLIYTAEFGELDARSLRRGDEGMLDDLVASWTEAGVAVLVADEAEHLSAAALDVLRDIMSRAAAPNADEATAHEEYLDRPRGLGVVVVGTPSVARRLRKTSEWRERWAREIKAYPLAVDALPDLYASYLPCFAHEAERRGSEKWAELVLEIAGPHYTGSMRLIETHIECYLALFCENAGEPPTTVEEVTFDEEIFAASMADVAVPTTEEVAA